MTDTFTPRSRREKILELVKQAGYMPIEALSSSFQVSTQTIRVELHTTVLIQVP